MKNIISVFFFSIILILLSCSDNNTVSPTLEIENPAKSVTVNDCQFYVSKIIDGSIGGEISIDTFLINLQGNSVRVEARLKIDSFSFEGIKEIRLIPDVNQASIQFFPEMNFNTPVKLQLVYTGIELEKLGFTSNAKIEFVFINDQGNKEPIEYSFCTINWPQQQLRVSNAKLRHFSRYAFVKKSL